MEGSNNFFWCLFCVFGNIIGNVKKLKKKKNYKINKKPSKSGESKLLNISYDLLCVYSLNLHAKVKHSKWEWNTTLMQSSLVKWLLGHVYLLDWLQFQLTVIFWPHLVRPQKLEQLTLYTCFTEICLELTSISTLRQTKFLKNTLHAFERT